mmetsp:Transcript_19320/g.53858  ORF Transcript_19320/g.53858 Transcript_19320/m.53858 type:complete len:210 (-) Transcript_19320:67-696(-)
MLSQAVEGLAYLVVEGVPLVPFRFPQFSDKIRRQPFGYVDKLLGLLSSREVWMQALGNAAPAQHAADRFAGLHLPRPVSVEIALCCWHKEGPQQPLPTLMATPGVVQVDPQQPQEDRGVLPCLSRGCGPWRFGPGVGMAFSPPSCAAARSLYRPTSAPLAIRTQAFRDSGSLSAAPMRVHPRRERANGWGIERSEAPCFRRQEAAGEIL